MIGASVPLNEIVVAPTVGPAVVGRFPAAGIADVMDGEGPTVWPSITTISPGATGPTSSLAAFMILVIAAGGAMLPRSPRATELPLGCPAAK